MATDRFRQSAFSHDTADSWLALVTISHADLPADILRVTDPDNLTSRGIKFKGGPFEVVLPRDTDTGILQGRLRMENVDREVGKELRLLDTAAGVKVELVRPDDPGTIEETYAGMQASDIQVDGEVVTVAYGLEDRRTEPFPAHAMVPGYFPAVF